jgi:hypothetical protein
LNLREKILKLFGISKNTIVDCHLLYVTKRTDNELFMVLPEAKGSQIWLGL